MKKLICLRWVAVGAVAAGLLGLSACEKDSGTEDAGSYFSSNPYQSTARQPPGDPALTISPNFASVTNSGIKVAFKASGGVPPYRWSVANGSGRISSYGSDGALYTVVTVAPNTVIVLDSAGHVADAPITAAAAAPSALAATANPSTLAKDGDKAVITASGGKSPYTFSVVDASLGHIVSSGPSSAVYIRDHVGDNAVLVKDSAGDTVYILITQP